MLKSFEKRVLRLSHASANLDWICRVHPDVRSNTKERFDKSLHKGADCRRQHGRDYEYLLERIQNICSEDGCILKEEYVECERYIGWQVY